MNFARFFVDRPIFAAVLSIVITMLGALAYKDNSIVGVHFTEDELCKLVMQLRKLVTQNTVAPTVSSQLH